MDIIVSNELNYAPKIVSEGRYEYTRLFPMSGSQSTTITAAGGSEVVFEIPPTKVFNFSKSWFQFSMAISNDDAVAGKYAWLWADFISMFRSIQVYTRGGLEMLNLNDANLFSKMVMKINKPLVETQCGYGSTPTTVAQNYVPCHSNNSPNAITVRYNNNPPDKVGTEPVYLLRGTQVVKKKLSVTATATIYFKDLFETILSLNRDLLFNETILLRFVFAPISNITFLGSDAANPTTGAAFNVGDVPITVDGMEVHLAIQRSLDIINSLQAKVASPEGMSVLIDYVYNNSVTLAASNNNTVTLRINRANGIILKRIYHSVFDTALNVTGTAYWGPYGNSNLAGAPATTVISFYCNLNNNRLNPYDYTCANFDDYRAIKHILDGSSIMSPNIYYFNWCWVQDFYDGTVEIEDQGSLIRGIDLNLGEQKWDFVATVNNAHALNNVSFVICKRKLLITSQGIIIN